MEICSWSRDVFKFWEITDNIRENGRRDTVTWETKMCIVE